MAALSARFCLLATVVLAAAAAGCGSGGIGGTIPQQNAATLRADVAAIQSAAAAGDCGGATAGVNQLEDDVNALPKTSGLELKDGLRTLIANLQHLINAELDCGVQPPTGASGVSGFQPPPATTSSSTTTTSTSEPPPGRSGSAPGHQKPKPQPKPGGGTGGGTGGVGPGGGDD